MPGTPAYRLYRSFWAGIDWLYPPHCGGCGEAGSRWCPDCQAKVQVLKPPLCQLCGTRVERAGLCRRCRLEKPAFEGLRSWAIFGGPIRNAIHRLKYQGDIALGEILARSMIHCLEGLGWAVDLVLPVPLSRARQAERGYNQAALLARPLALASGLRYKPRALKRSRETRSQVGLSVEQRRQNVAGAFLSNPREVLGQKVLLIDDVATSGATIEACSQSLRAAGAAAVYALTLARAF